MSQVLTSAEIEECYAHGRGMEEFARRIEAKVLAKASPRGWRPGVPPAGEPAAPKPEAAVVRAVFDVQVRGFQP